MDSLVRMHKGESMENSIVQDDIKNIINNDLPWHEFEGKTILITGANGFLPAYMVETLLYLNDTGLRKKCKIIALVRNVVKAQIRFSKYQDREDFHLLVQDVCKPLNIRNNIDYIIHAASQASPKYYGLDPVGTLSANVIGTYNLLEVARKKKVKGFLFFSSGEVYGEVNSNQIPTKETDFGFIDPINVRSCYSESKRMGETMCISWFHQYGVPVKIVRPFHTYGPGMTLNDGRVFADFVSNIVERSDIVMKSDGSAIRAFCYLEDAIIGFYTVLLKGKCGEAYNVANSKGEISILNLANILANLMPGRKVNVIRCKNEENKGYLQSKISRNCPDITKVRLLGWEPKYSIEEGFKRTITSFIL